MAQAYTPYDENRNPGAPVFTEYFMAGVYEVHTDANSAVTGTIKYYAIAGMTVAMNDGSGLQYLLTDQLGSVVAVTDSSGTLISQQRYMPFGQVRTDVSSGTATDLGFTGQRNLDAQGNESLGLMDYHARMYDAVLGRFIQPDTIIPDSKNPQSLNRYAYVVNDPIALNDPTGHRFSDHMDPTEKKIILNTYRRNARGGHHHGGGGGHGGGSNGNNDKLDNVVSSSFDGGWNYPQYSTWNLLRQGSPCAACHVTHWTGTIPTNSELDVNLVLYYRHLDPTAKLVHAYLFYQIASTGSDLASYSAPTRGETADTILGKATHNDYPNILQEPSLDYNRPIPTTRLRPDAIDWNNNIVRELKPDNPRAIGRGLTQLGKYVDALQDLTGETWTGILDLYPK